MSDYEMLRRQHLADAMVLARPLIGRLGGRPDGLLSTVCGGCESWPGTPPSARHGIGSGWRG